MLSSFKKKMLWIMVAHALNPSTQKAERGKRISVSLSHLGLYIKLSSSDHPGLCNKTLSKSKRKKKRRGGRGEMIPSAGCLSKAELWILGVPIHLFRKGSASHARGDSRLFT